MKKTFSTIAAAVLLSFTTVAANANSITYTCLDVPRNVNTSWKTWMDWRTITNRHSDQYKFIQNWAWSDYDGFMRCNGEKDLGITDNYYLVALGSYYGTKIGTKYKITTDTGNVFYAVLADCKADIHTNSTHQYAGHNDVVEFIINYPNLINSVKQAGSANVYMPLNGQIQSIERMDFINE